ncbi:sugar ABC transporter permease [Paenibacillus sp. SYP-B3998]|uniref:Sugar ABC transporter permease n=1 Tax=Paenibacillus sp. SYP-B3998 TaxID=2678564 RepID=A0A6G4A1P6_9BACL|nr:ABC transporter permease subunit [Paenibacillus sp. SYP-B3998]NEW07567.1 sugar ABC transporter permease [Paenibacillus sp. SYP-B3998]
MRETATVVHTDRPVVKPRKSKLVSWLKQWPLQIMVLPALVLILVFSYFPMYGVIIAFQDYSVFKGFWNSPWVGFKHFIDFFQSPELTLVMRNTLVISFLKLAFGFPAPIILAILLNEVRSMIFKRVVQTVSYLPYFLSWVIVANFAISMLSTDNGSVNILLGKLHLIDEPIPYLSVPEYFWTILVTTNVWKEIGFASIVYLAAIASIDPNLYEAAAIDGASRFRMTYLITLPSILPVVVIFSILAIGNLLNAGFEDLLLLGVNPALRDVSDVIDTYVFRMGINLNRYSFATAVGLFKAIVSVGLLTLANYFARRTGNSLW